jgi:hypothetical protein
MLPRLCLCLICITCLGCTSPVSLCQAVVARDMVDRLTLLRRIEGDLARGYERRSTDRVVGDMRACGSVPSDTCAHVDTVTETRLAPIARAELLRQGQALLAEAQAEMPALRAAQARCVADPLSMGRNGQ